jgi:hypothetical protein
MALNRERVGILGLVGFLVVDALLVALALNSTRGEVAEGGTTTPTGRTPAVTRTASGPSTTGAASAEPGIKVVPLTVGVVGIDEATALRFRTGTCTKGGAALELTTNGGESWGPRATKFDVLTRVRVRDNGSAFAVGGSRGSECTPQIRQTSKYDGEWGAASVVNDAWFRDPRDPRSVGLPTGGTGHPCGTLTVTDLAVVDSAAAALCADGAVLVSRTGASWRRAATVPSALALSLDSDARAYLAVPGADQCAGLAVVEAGAPDKALGCAELDASEIAPGTVALSVSAGPGWLVAGDQSFHSGADLKTWKKS